MGGRLERNASETERASSRREIERRPVSSPEEELLGAAVDHRAELLEQVEAENTIRGFASFAGNRSAELCGVVDRELNLAKRRRANTKFSAPGLKHATIVLHFASG